VVYGRRERIEALDVPKLAPAPEQAPERLETGTLNHEGIVGAGAAVDFLASLAGQAHRVAGDRRQQLLDAMAAVDEHELRLRRRIEAGLAELPGVTVHSRAARRTPTLLLTFADAAPEQAYRFLAERGVNAPAGSFYAVEASRFLGLGDGGGLRVGLAPYNDDADVDRLLAGLAEFRS
jgi:selenocysteine lyase/cysteine desulfurase